MSEKNKWVLYHAECMDGYAAAWAIWKVLGESAYYQAVRHNEPLPTVPDEIELYIVDFCYPMEVLALAAQRVKKIVVLDHHISAQKEYEAYCQHHILPNNLEVKFIQEQSGCVLAWHYFHKEETLPQLLRHIQDHDLWQHQLPKTEAICRALYLCLPMPFAAFEKLKLSTLASEGAVLLRQQQLNVRRLSHARHKVILNGIEGLAVNAPAMFSSDLGHVLAELSGTYGLTYSWQGQRQLYECSLRSIGEFDVSVLATHFNGGGHQNAAGFKVEQSVFLKFL